MSKEKIQTQYTIVKEDIQKFIKRENKTNKLLHLHGPFGSGKSTIIDKSKKKIKMMQYCLMSL